MVTAAAIESLFTDKSPVHVDERRIARKLLTRYAIEYGSEKGRRSDEMIANDIHEWCKHDNSPSKTAIGKFIEGSTDTSHRTVRIIKAYLVANDYCKSDDFDIVIDGARLIQNYATFLNRTNINYYGNRFTAKIDIFSSTDFTPRVNLVWNFRNSDMGVFTLVESHSLPDKHMFGQRSGYAMCLKLGHIIGVLTDVSRDRSFRFTLEPVKSSFDEHTGFDAQLAGVLTKLTDGDRFEFSRLPITGNIRYWKD